MAHRGKDGNKGAVEEQGSDGLADRRVAGAVAGLSSRGRNKQQLDTEGDADKAVAVAVAGLTRIIGSGRRGGQRRSLRSA